MPKENIKFGIAFTKLDWKVIINALEYRARRAEEMNIDFFAVADRELANYIKVQLKKFDN
jgi:hypothetical protein